MTVAEVGKPPRRRAALGDMVRSFGLMAIVVGVTLLFVPGLLHPGKSQRFPAVDYSSYLLGFGRLSHAPALAPVGLPDGWRANAGRLTGGARSTHLHIGWAVPGNTYVALEEGVQPAARFVPAVLGGRGRTVTGSVTVAGASWQTRLSSLGERSLTRSFGRVTVVITGSAVEADLERLAGSLR